MLSTLARLAMAVQIRRSRHGGARRQVDRWGLEPRFAWLLRGAYPGLACTDRAELRLNDPLPLPTEGVAGAPEALASVCRRVIIADPDCGVCLTGAVRWSEGEMRDSIPTVWVVVANRRRAYGFASLLGSEADVLRFRDVESASQGLRWLGLFGSPYSLVVDGDGVVREQRAGFATFGREGREA